MSIIVTSARRYCDPSCLLVGLFVIVLVRSLTFVGAHYLENGWRYRLGYKGAPIGNGTWSIKWSHLNANILKIVRDSLR